MEITLEEAFEGKTAQIRIPTSVTCEVCSGSGAKAGTKPKPCATCGGAGKIRHAQGFFTLERTCPTCQGRGQVIDDPCAACGGAGRVTRERTLSVNIPAGVEDGTRIRLAGEGEAGMRGGPAGDLYIFLSLKPHALLPARRRRPLLPGADLHGDGGAGRRVRGADHRRRARRRSRSRTGPSPASRFRLSGKGMPVLRAKQIGDMYVQVAVETPQNLTKRQRELLAEFEKLSSEDTQPESAGFFGRVKEFLDGLGNRRQPFELAILTPCSPPYTRGVADLTTPAACTRDPVPMPSHTFARVEKKRLRLDDEMRFIRSWLEKPLSTGAVTPSSKALARTMARYVDPQSTGPVIELGPGTGPVTEALVQHGIDPKRLVLVEFNPDFCHLLRSRYPAATVVQGDAYRLRRLLGDLIASRPPRWCRACRCSPSRCARACA